MKIEVKGLGFILTVIFVVLKLTGKVSWSWLWVFSPLWLGIAIAVVFMGICMLFAALTGQLPRGRR